MMMIRFGKVTCICLKVEQENEALCGFFTATAKCGTFLEVTRFKLLSLNWKQDSCLWQPLFWKFVAVVNAVV
jgi:hypothetical protein